MAEICEICNEKIGGGWLNLTSTGKIEHPVLKERVIHFKCGIDESNKVSMTCSGCGHNYNTRFVAKDDHFDWAMPNKIELVDPLCSECSK